MYGFFDMDIYTKTLIMKHNAGFFSCCNIKLYALIHYFNTHKELPLVVDSSRQFEWYKTPKNMKKDITNNYFVDDDLIDIYILYNNPINYHCNYQFVDYKLLDYRNISLFIKKYFTPTKEIIKIIDSLQTNYQIDYENTCVLFYRGLNKVTETQLCPYEEYMKYVNIILEKNPNMRFFIQSDETEFITYISKQLLNNSFYMYNETRHINKCNDTSLDLHSKDNIEYYSKNFLAITLIMSKCKYIICGTGNCSLWIMFYRGNNNNTYQYLNGTWYENITS